MEKGLVKISHQQQLICIYLWKERQCFAHKKLPTKPSRLMGLLMTNELASFRGSGRWSIWWWGSHGWSPGLALITPQSLSSSSEVTTMISWSMTRGWSSYEATMKYGHKKKCPRVSKNLVVGVKQRADAGDTSPFSPMPLQISALSHTIRFCATYSVLQVSLYRLLLPISTHVSTFFESLSLCSRQSEDENRLFGALIESCAWFWRFEAHYLFCQHCTAWLEAASPQLNNYPEHTRQVPLGIEDCGGVVADLILV